jgi:PAS domain S-box-containing protein
MLKVPSSLRAKVFWIVVAVSTAGMLIMAFAALISQIEHQRSAFVERNRMLAELAAERSVPAFRFQDFEVVEIHLEALSSDSSVRYACAYDVVGVLVASHAASTNAVCPGDPPELGHHFTMNQLETAVAVDAGSGILGTILLVASNRALIDGITGYVLLILITGVGIVAGVAYIARRVTSDVVRPIHELTSATQRIRSGDLAQSVTVSGGEELEELAETFNLMSRDLRERIADLGREIAERRRAQAAQEQSETNLRTIIDLIPYMIFARDDNGRLLFANPAVAEFYGTTQETLLAGEFPEAADADGVLFADDSTETPSIDQEVWFMREGGDHRLLRVSRVRFPLMDHDASGTLVIAADITEERRLQEQLRHSQKLETIGTLAGGIAHDFNNLLTPILGYATMLLESEAEPKRREQLKAISNATHRGKDLVKQILTFSRQSQEPQSQILDIVPLVDEATRLLRATIPKTVEIEFVHDDAPLRVLADPGQMHQVIVNLGTNAAQAIPESRGHVRIRVRPVQLHHSSLDLEPGDYAEIEVSDDGTGMNSYVLDRIFEPFFTTKDVGEGTGLGLAVVHGIVTGHRGHIDVQSAIGKGTTFRVLLPIAASADAPEHADRADVHGTGERVLLVDDETPVTHVTSELLRRLGYEVTACTDPTEALALFGSAPANFDVVITDSNMPKMNGYELAHALRRARKDIPIILCTGMLDDDPPLDGTISTIVTKPLSGLELSRVIREVIAPQLASSN